MPGFWSLPEPQFRTKMFECEGDVCEGGQDNPDGIAKCKATNTGRQCADCSESMYKFNGNCFDCPHAVLTLLYIGGVWLGWYFLNSVLCEHIETADQFFFFVQFSEVIGGFSLSWPHAMENMSKLFDSLDFDVHHFELVHIVHIMY